MAIAVTTIFECNASATGSNVNGGGFNPGNANFPTDLTATNANTAAPVVSSASYTFVAGDAGHWVYIKSGTNWIAGWYKIASVAGGAATLDADVGEAILLDTALGAPAPGFKTNTSAGCASVSSPSSGTYGVDYTQGTAAIINNTDLACPDGDAAAPTVTSVGSPFGINHTGNLIHITAGTGYTAGWYEIVSISVATATLDRAIGTDGAKSGGTFYVAGAMSLNSTLDDDFFELGFGTNGSYGVRFCIKNGSYTLGEVVTVASSGGTQSPVVIEGYNLLRGDVPVGDNRPLITCAANSFNPGSNWDIYHIRMTGTATNVSSPGVAAKVVNCKFINTSTTANRNGFSSNNDLMAFNCEAVSYRGRALNWNNGQIIGCWLHDSDTGFYDAVSSGVMFTHSIISSCVTYAVNINYALANFGFFTNLTLYGSENTTGIGINFITGATDVHVINCIITGFATGVTHADTQYIGFDDYNDYYNNDTDATNWKKGVHDIAVNPSFTSVSQITGTTAIFHASNGRIIDTGKNFTTAGVVAERDYIYIVSGTGVTAGIYGISSIATTTNPNDTLMLDINPGTDTTADKVYQITIGHNFLPTGAL